MIVNSSFWIRGMPKDSTSSERNSREGLKADADPKKTGRYGGKKRRWKIA